MRPEHLSIARDGATRRVELTGALGGVSYVYLVSENGERVIVEERGDDRISTGETVGLTYDTRNLRVFDAESGLRIR